MSKLTKVQKAWSDSVGRPIAFEVEEVKHFDGREQTRLINPETGSIVVAVDAVGDEAEALLVENAGVPFLDQAFSPEDIAGPNEGNQVNKSDSSVPVPSSRPGAAVEAKKSKDADKLAEDK